MSLNRDALLGCALLQKILGQIPQWEEIRKRMQDPEIGGRIELIGPTDQGSDRHNRSLQVLAEGFKGMKLLVPGGPCTRAHVDPEEGFHFGAGTETRIDHRARFCFERNLFALWAGELEPSDAQVQSLIYALARVRSELLNAGREELEKLLEVTAPYDAGMAIQIFLAARTQSSFVEQKRRSWLTATTTTGDRLADWFRLFAELTVFIACRIRMKDHRPMLVESLNKWETARWLVDAIGRHDGDNELFKRQIEVVTVLLNNMVYHGVGNLSTFAGMIAASGDASPYVAYSAANAALFGPNHGGAAPYAGGQWIAAQAELGLDATPEHFRSWFDLRKESGQLVMACGHALLKGKNGDPRTRALLALLSEHYGEEPLYRFVRNLYETAEQMLREKGKLQFPSTNVDGYTFAALNLVGLLKPDEIGECYMLFALARSMGTGKEAFWWSVPKTTILRPSSPLPWHFEGLGYPHGDDATL